MSRMAAAPSYSLLYSGLEPDSAGEVVRVLEQRGVVYDIRGSSIFVDGSMRDELRMTLASDGLPTLNGQGYELLDSISGFGTTAQMFDAAYWRAKEGELARTIVAGAQIRTARVHIANTASGPFRRDGNPTASVTATGASGALSGDNAKALRFLVASAVSGLLPENVSVIDGRSGVVVSSDRNDSLARTGVDRAAELKRNVERLVEAWVGVGNAIVEVNIETVTEREAISETRFDPDSRVAISSETQESTSVSNDSGGGAVTVASNLPDGDAAGGGKDSSSENSKTSERVNFEVSETRREILRIPGAIKRVSTAVLVEGLYETDGQTGEKTWSPRSDDEMQALQELIASAVGLNLDRGDTLTLKSMQLKSTTIEATSEKPPFAQKLNLDFMQLIQFGVLALVTMVLGLFVLRPILVRSAVPALPRPAANDEPARALTNDTGSGAGPANLRSQPEMALTGEIDEGNRLPVNMPAREGRPPTGISAQEVLAAPADPVDQLRRMIENRQEETVEILRNWIEDGEERVG